MTKKLKLQDLSLDSFITNVDAEKSKTYAGGITGIRCNPTDRHTCPTQVCPSNGCGFTLGGTSVCCWSAAPTNCDPCGTNDGSCYTSPGGCA